MGKKFWKYVVLFWILLLAFGASTVLYIKQQQALERKEFVAKFNYDANPEDLLEEETVTMHDEYALIPYDENSFLNSVQAVLTEVYGFETAIHNFSSNKKDEAVAYTLEAYQQTKSKIPLFANITIPNSSLLDEKIYQKISNATYNYLKSASIYFIVQARAYNNKSETLQAQLQQTKDTMSESKNHLDTLLQLTEAAK